MINNKKTKQATCLRKMLTCLKPKQIWKEIHALYEMQHSIGGVNLLS